MIPIHKEGNLMGIYKESTPLVPVRDKILVNKQEASALIALGESTIERLMKQDAIPYLKIGGRVLFSVEQLVNWVALKGNSDDTRSSSCDLKMQGGQNE
jgi:excisionase family DNA binding protein